MCVQSSSPRSGYDPLQGCISQGGWGVLEAADFTPDFLRARVPFSRHQVQCRQPRINPGLRRLSSSGRTRIRCCQDVLLSRKVVASCCSLFPCPKGWFCILTLSRRHKEGVQPQLQPCRLTRAAFSGAWSCQPSGRSRQIWARQSHELLLGRRKDPASPRAGLTLTAVSPHFVGKHTQRAWGSVLRGNGF